MDKKLRHSTLPRLVHFVPSPIFTCDSLQKSRSLHPTTSSALFSHVSIIFADTPFSQHTIPASQPPPPNCRYPAILEVQYFCAALAINFAFCRSGSPLWAHTSSCYASVLRSGTCACCSSLAGLISSDTLIASAAPFHRPFVLDHNHVKQCCPVSEA